MSPSTPEPANLTPPCADVTAPAASIFLLVFASIQGVSASPLDCRSEAQNEVREFSASSHVEIIQIGALKHGKGWLEIEEDGFPLRIESGTATIDVAEPLRYGWHWVEVHSGSTVTVRRPEQIRVASRFSSRLVCGSENEEPAVIPALRQLSKLDKELDRSQSETQLETLLHAEALLETQATDEKILETARTYRAVLLIANGHSRMALPLLAQSAAAWRSLGDIKRSGVLDMYYAETLSALGEHQAVLALPPPAPGEQTSSSYISTRSREVRCLALEKLQRLAEAKPCLQSVLASYAKLGEVNEHAVAQQSFASLLRDAGDYAAAESAGLQAIREIGQSGPADIRGKLWLTLADIALRRGQVVRSMQDTQTALTEFTQANEATWRWQANCYLHLAIIYSQLGAHSEAYDALRTALKLLEGRDAPSRLAVAMNVFADIETDAGNQTSALLWRYAAENLYSRLGIVAARDATRMLRLGLELEVGRYAAVESALHDRREDAPLYQAQWRLLSADLALREHRLDDAQRDLAAVQSQPLSLTDQIRYTQLQAQYLERTGMRQVANQTLLSATARIANLSAQTTSGLLRQLLMRQALPLRKTALGLALNAPQDTATPADAVAAIWPWLTPSPAFAPVDANPSPKQGSEQFDRAVAADLLTPTASRKLAGASAAPRELLSILTRDSAATRTNVALPAASLAALQNQLGADTVFIAYVDAGHRGALLRVTHDEASLVDAADPAQVRSSAAALVALLHSPAAAVNEISAAARTLSTQLLQGLASTPAPAHLLVLNDETSSRVAWSALTWPDARAPLAETTAVELVALDHGSASFAHEEATPLHILVAAQQQSNATPLPALATAAVESKLIEDALPSTVAANTHTDKATRSALLSALGDAHAWVHVAAHGAAHPERIGYSGVWLEPAGPEDNEPTFLSGLDILDRGVRADLVVLDACQLGDSGEAINGNLSFAAAVSQAGARQVVAAAWPVSDAAAAIWVPAFYSALVADPQHDAADALRVAQLRLRHSRAFTHPFFWAGLQATRRLSLAPTAIVASPAIAGNRHDMNVH